MTNDNSSGSSQSNSHTPRSLGSPKPSILNIRRKSSVMRSFSLLNETQIAMVPRDMGSPSEASIEIVFKMMEKYQTDKMSLGGFHPLVRCMGSTTPNVENSAYLYTSTDLTGEDWGGRALSERTFEKGFHVVRVNDHGDRLNILNCCDNPSISLMHLQLVDETTCGLSSTTA
eukprot:TRINITY_DN4408_c0_g1_i1.p1 TRINITY_DN4408_c0_g1~~TRINITY_DN4408_c0_g1_i1.p1  ORF type:complete len:193 (+),score=28.64 TRINITY_DN4408_c0_g1_i1:66-581(+)